jgi:dolichol kinase
MIKRIEGRHVFAAAKVLLYMVLVSTTGSLLIATALIIAFISTYGYAVAYLKGWQVMGIQDNLCLYDSEESVGNVSCKSRYSILIV